MQLCLGLLILLMLLSLPIVLALSFTGLLK
jgi:hypothetical protein